MWLNATLTLIYRNAHLRLWAFTYKISVLNNSNNQVHKESTVAVIRKWKHLQWNKVLLEEKRNLDKNTSVLYLIQSMEWETDWTVALMETLYVGMQLRCAEVRMVSYKKKKTSKHTDTVLDILYDFKAHDFKMYDVLKSPG